MRVFRIAAVALAAHGLFGCAQIISAAALSNTKEKFQACIAENKATPEYQMLAVRLWQNDGTDTAAKLSDPKPLAPNERDALVKVHTKSIQCRQILIVYDNQFAAWETPYLEELNQRGDQVFYKLASGELPVGIANKLLIESVGQFQVDVSKGHANAVQIEEAQRQRMAETLIQANAQIAASQPRMTTTNCTWVANTMNCTGMR